MGDPEKLEELASEWVGVAKLNEPAHVERIESLDADIERMNAAIGAVIAATARATQSEEAIAAATASLNLELAQLKEMRQDAVAWLEEVQESERRANDLAKLATMAHTRLVEVTPDEQAQIYGLLDLKVYIDGPVPPARSGPPCKVAAWYRTEKRAVPAGDMTDAEWQAVSAVLQRVVRPDMRQSIDALFCKARTAQTWESLPSQYGDSKAHALTKYRLYRWLKNGTWEAIDAALASSARVVLGQVNLLPPMHIEGRLDPRVMLVPAERSGTGW
ncbi:transposase [Yinghuangia aomiensis]